MIHGRKRSLFHIKLRDLGVEIYIPNAGKSIDHKYCFTIQFGHMQFLIDLRFTGKLCRRGLQVTEPMQLQMDVQQRLQDQLEAIYLCPELIAILS